MPIYKLAGDTILSRYSHRSYVIDTDHGNERQVKNNSNLTFLGTRAVELS